MAKKPLKIVAVHKFYKGNVTRVPNEFDSLKEAYDYYEEAASYWDTVTLMFCRRHKECEHKDQYNVNHIWPVGYVIPESEIEDISDLKK